MSSQKEYIAIQMELVLLMQHHICWNDRKDIGRAMSYARWAYKEQQDEMDKLYPCAADTTAEKGQS